VFNLAGKVSNVSLFRDRDGRNRGIALVEYATGLEALNAITMFDKQVLNDREMSVRFDTKPKESEPNLPSKEFNLEFPGLMVEECWLDPSSALIRLLITLL
jgi:RNA recognition motif-containing protein